MLASADVDAVVVDTAHGHSVYVLKIIKEIKAPITIMNASEEEMVVDRKLTKKEKEKMISQLEKEMKQAAKDLDFERAVELRDLLFALKNEE